MQFAFFTAALVACMTVFVSASPVPAAVQVLARAPQLTPVVVAREPQISPPPPPPICGSYQCI
ncbi:hypothetical protein GALMADRAFT_146441 [Galerina marginata CBS 339.88]|uniref:Uncharacterized protein n=1 Tax=Galerina marginata (strain CBS 339.88) TaxID=685588 RepID=A0A067SDV9_GALM3|nr:hypothetical protein GALMADRAFT_146441 [Galerina marginata CBS 339.88]